LYLTKLASIQFVNWNMIEKYSEDPLTLFTKANLDPKLMYQDGARYPLSKIAHLWKEMDLAIKDPCYGLSAAVSWHPSNFGTLGYAMLASTSIRTTLERLLRFHRVISDANFGKLYENVEKSVITFCLTNSDEEKYSIGRQDAALAWLLSLLRVNFQRPFSPLAVGLTHSKPACEGKYFEFFKCPVHFNQDRAYLDFSVNDADRILPTGNDALLRFKEQAMTDYLLAKDSLALIPRVTKCIAHHLPSGDANIEKVASDLFMSTRKLQRLLKEEDTSFIELLNTIRQDLAEQYVKDRNMDLTEIAFLLGFSEQSTFSRSFKRWTGTSPTKFRKAA
jgi:AraC-like DNA-binding protein